MTDFERGFILKCAEAGIPNKISESMLKTAIEHAVVDGDTLESLSERYGVPARALAYVNRRVLGGGAARRRDDLACAGHCDAACKCDGGASRTGCSCASQGQAHKGFEGSKGVYREQSREHKV